MKRLVAFVLALPLVFNGLFVQADEALTPENLEGYYASVEESSLKGFNIEPETFTIFVDDLKEFDTEEDPLRFELSKWAERIEELEKVDATKSVADEDIEEDTQYFEFVEIDEEDELYEIAPFKIVVYNPEYKVVSEKFIVKDGSELLFRFTLEDATLTDDWDNSFSLDEEVVISTENEDSENSEDSEDSEDEEAAEVSSDDEE